VLDLSEVCDALTLGWKVFLKLIRPNGRRVILARWRAGPMADVGACNLASEHLRAICDEIGERLRWSLSRELPEPSVRLQVALLRLREADEIAPSVVPSIEELTGGWQSQTSENPEQQLELTA